MLVSYWDKLLSIDEVSALLSLRINDLKKLSEKGEVLGTPLKPLIKKDKIFYQGKDVLKIYNRLNIGCKSY